VEGLDVVLTSFEKDTILRFIESRGPNDEVSGAIEEFYDRYPVTDAERGIFERVLSFSSPYSRMAALEALIDYGGFSGYEADALLLQYEFREIDDEDDFASIRLLFTMRTRGSKEAARVLDLLFRQEYVRTLYGEHPTLGLHNKSS
jgi:hypothetical protein